MLSQLTLSEFLDETASQSPAPGGGSVSALAASLSAALTSMVCRLTIGKKKYASVRAEMESALIKSEQFRTECTTLIDEDTKAFERVMNALKMPKDTEEAQSARGHAIQEATKSATRIPLRLMKLCAEAMDLMQVVMEKGNQNSLSDVGVAVLMLRAGCKGAGLNVQINLRALEDSGFVENANGEADSALEHVRRNSERLLREIEDRIGARI